MKYLSAASSTAHSASTTDVEDLDSHARSRQPRRALLLTNGLGLQHPVEIVRVPRRPGVELDCYEVSLPHGTPQGQSDVVSGGMSRRRTYQGGLNGADAKLARSRTSTDRWSSADLQLAAMQSAGAVVVLPQAALAAGGLAVTLYSAHGAYLLTTRPMGLIFRLAGLYGYAGFACAGAIVGGTMATEALVLSRKLSAVGKAWHNSGSLESLQLSNELLKTYALKRTCLMGAWCLSGRATLTQTIWPAPVAMSAYEALGYSIYLGSFGAIFLLCSMGTQKPPSSKQVAAEA